MSEPKKMGRKTKYVESTIKKIEQSLANGFPRTVACAAGGICQETYYRWRNLHPEFAERMDVAVGKSEEALVRRMMEAAEDDWKAAKFLLERRFRHWNSVPYSKHSDLDEMNRLKIERARLELDIMNAKLDALRRLEEPEGTVTVLEVLGELQSIEDKRVVESNILDEEEVDAVHSS
jgi:hypothetical protein